jgi:hypothetical protein
MCVLPTIHFLFMLGAKDFRPFLGTNGHRSENRLHCACEFYTHAPLGVTVTPSAKETKLAEGQRGEKVKHFLTGRPPSANWDNWRDGSNFRRKTHVLSVSERHLA